MVRAKAVCWIVAGWAMVNPGFIVKAQVPISGRLVGTVQNESGVPQTNVQVTLRYRGATRTGGLGAGQARTTLTNAAGFFVIDQIEPGLYEVTAQAPFFEPVKALLEILTAKAKIVTITLGRQNRMAVTADIYIDG